ncbi:MAG: GspH/FimT family protein [Candidatus Methylomirabilales bacterium]
MENPTAGRRPILGSQAGISLIEVILVMVLLGLLAALAVPRFPSPPRAGAAARRLVFDLQYAKELATRSQTMSGIYFVSGTEYRVFQNNDINQPTRDPLAGGDFVVTMSNQFSGVTITQFFAGNTIKFDSLGTPLDGADAPLGAPGTITLSFDGKTWTVTVQPNTGKVTMS